MKRLTVSNVKKTVDTVAKPIKEIEKKGREMTVTEAKKLAILFRTTTDYIIFGKGAPDLTKGWNRQ